MRNNREELRDKLTDDRFRYFYQMRVLAFTLGFVALVMSIMNIATHKSELLIATSCFSVLSFINFALLVSSGKCKSFNYIFLLIPMCALFIFFLITGGTAGFSPHWILILPACGMLFFGKKIGFWSALCMFFIVIFLLWFPIGNALLRYDFSPEFRMRFPVVYATFFAIGYIFEFIRSLAYDELIATQQAIKNLSITDFLTGIHNRMWFNDTLTHVLDNWSAGTSAAMVLIDLDEFKSVNDKYGHIVGDEVLKGTARAIEECLDDKALLCRWGGEEFSIFLPDCGENKLFDICHRICSTIAGKRYPVDDGSIFSVTASVGAVISEKNQSVDQDTLFCRADEAMYKAKSDGKNTVVIWKL